MSASQRAPQAAMRASAMTSNEPSSEAYASSDP
jgi:hypothetical protein